MDRYLTINLEWLNEIKLESAFMLSALVSHCAETGLKEFTFDKEVFYKELKLTEYAVKQGLTELKEKGFIEVKQKGLPCRNYYKVITKKV